jgi:hypothetical protein
MNSGDDGYEPFKYLGNFFLFVIGVGILCFGIPAIQTAHLRGNPNFGDLALGAYLIWWGSAFLLFTWLVFYSAYRSYKTKNGSQDQP